MDQDTAGRTCCIFLMNLLLIICACMAAKNADTAVVSDACGSFLRVTVVLDIIANWLFWIALLVITCIFASSHPPERAQKCTASITAGIFTVVLAFLSGWTLHYTVDAHQNQSCIDAMSSKTGGLESPSANMGTPFLLIIGYVYGVIYTLCTFISLIVTCCCGCLSAEK